MWFSLMVERQPPVTFGCRSLSPPGSFPQANTTRSTQPCVPRQPRRQGFKIKLVLLSGSELFQGQACCSPCPVTKVIFPVSVFCKLIDRVPGQPVCLTEVALKTRQDFCCVPIHPSVSEMSRCPLGFVILKWALVVRASQKSNSQATCSPQCPSLPCPSSTVELS